MKLRTRFGLIVVASIFAVLGIGFLVVRRHQEEAIEDAAYKRAYAVLAFAEACRGMVRENLRPAVTGTDEFTPELMSSTFVTRRTFAQLEKSLPAYVYRQPTLSPLNPVNRADAFEAEIIQRFRESPGLELIKGTREVDGRASYFGAKPEVVQGKCLACHGEPDKAPAGLVERYGGQSGFGWTPGEVAGLTMVTVPIDDLLESQASLNTHVFWVFLVVTLCLGYLIDLTFDRMVNRRLDNAAEIMERVAADPALHLRVDVRDGEDEISHMARAFNHMADSVQSAAAELEKRVQRRTSELNDARQSERAKDEFLANMSHELRTPLTAILGFTEELTLESSRMPPDCVEVLGVISENGKQLLRLINDILDISKIIAGEMEVEKRDWSPIGLLEDVRAVMTPQAEKKGIELVTKADEYLPDCVVGDVFRTKQILYNLVGNAIKFTEKGSVTLSVHYEGGDAGGTLMLDVKDTGIGIAPDVAARVFQRFRQADGSTTRRFGGTGLGLDISKGLATLLGGDLELVESRPGVGSHFRVTLPVQAACRMARSDERTPQESQAKTLGDLRGKLNCRLLVAEDNPVNQRIVARVLEHFGADVQLVPNGREAVDRARQALSEGRPFDVILMDMHMPVMDGLEAIRTLRQEGYEKPIVVLSAAVMPAEIESCREAGCDAVACKPIEREELFAVLAGFVGDNPEAVPSAGA